MKMLLTDHVRLGAVCAEQLSVSQAHGWRLSRMERFTELITIAVQQNASYLALTGNLLGSVHMTESLIDTLYHEMQAHPEICFLVFLPEQERMQLACRKDVPENLQFLTLDSDDTYLDEQIALRLMQGGMEFQLSDHPSVWLHYRKSGDSDLVMEGNAILLSSFEPLGFEDAARGTFGYLCMEWDKTVLPSCKKISKQQYTYHEARLELSPAETQSEILQKLRQSVTRFERNTFLRLTVCGRTAFGITLDAAAIKQELEKRVFFAQVFDNTEMDIDVQAFENDISLSSEFVRLALADDSISDTERSRLISRGWNALGGKAVSE